MTGITEKYSTPEAVALSLRTGPIQQLVDASEGGGMSWRACLLLAGELLNVARSMEAFSTSSTKACYLGGPHVFREDEGTCTWCDKGPSEVTT